MKTQTRYYAPLSAPHLTEDDHENQKPFVYLLLIAWALCPIRVSWPLYSWIFLGLLVFFWKLSWIVRNLKLDWKEEFYLALKTPFDGFFGCIAGWPFELASFAFTRKYSSFAFSYEMREGNRIYEHLILEGVNRQTVRDSIGEDSRRALKFERERAAQFKKTIEDVPAAVEGRAKGAYACGLIATALAGAATPTQAQTPRTNAGTSLYGWITLVGHSDVEKDEVTLRHVRIRPTLTFTPDLWAFGDLEMREIQPSGQNWMKQAWIGYSPDHDTTIRVGRLALTPIAVVPPPFLLETVNFPRLPYNFFAYGLQAERKMGAWKIAADVSGRSGRGFQSEGQFSNPEASLRIEHNFPRNVRLAFETQAGEDSVVTGLDWHWNRKGLRSKGAAYMSEKNSERIAGGYTYFGIEPHRSIEIFAQFDAEKRTSRDPNFIISSGITLKADKRKSTLTLGHEWRPDGRREGTLLLKAQLVF